MFMFAAREIESFIVFLKIQQGMPVSLNNAGSKTSYLILHVSQDKRLDDKRKLDEQAKAAEMEKQRREQETKAAEMEKQRREQEAIAAEMEKQRREQEAKVAADKERQRLEQEAIAAKDEIQRREQEARAAAEISQTQQKAAEEGGEGVKGIKTAELEKNLVEDCKILKLCDLPEFNNSFVAVNLWEPLLARLRKYFILKGKYRYL